MCGTNFFVVLAVLTSVSLIEFVESGPVFYSISGPMHRAYFSGLYPESNTAQAMKKLVDNIGYVIKRTFYTPDQGHGIVGTFG